MTPDEREEVAIRLIVARAMIRRLRQFDRAPRRGSLADAALVANETASAWARLEACLDSLRHVGEHDAADDFAIEADRLADTEVPA